MYLILFVLNNPDRLEDVLDTWERAGVSGITILPGTGLGRIRQSGLRDDLPLIPSLEDFYRREGNINYTLFSLMESEALVHKVVMATEAVVGPLEQPGNGILAVLPVLQIHGLIPRPLE